MSSPSRPPSYIAVLRTPQACRVFGAALLGRLSYGTVFLSLVLALTSATGSYAVAGGAMALFGLTSSLLSPLRADLIDRYGPRRALPPMAVLYALLLVCLAAATWQPGASGALLATLAVAAGACTPPLGPVMRTLWSDLLADRQLLQRAYSLDTVAEELLFVTGPLLAGLLAALAKPAAGVALSALLVLIGTFALVSSPVVRAAQTLRAGTVSAGMPHPGPDTDPASSRWRQMYGMGGLIHPVVVSVGVGMCLGALSLLMVVFAGRHHQGAAVAWVEAALSVGSAVGGLAYGAVSWRVSGQVRLSALAAALGLTLAAAGFSPNLYVLAAVAGVAGLFVAPALTTAYLLADESAAPQNRTRAGAWVNTAFNIGASSGTAAIGLLVGNLPLALCFVVAAAPALLSAVMALGRQRRSATVPALNR
ncbi:Predicted arabinose efflux permease, MFS family [Streptosporangium subroseum]|uniref:Predicted arabinose efflux permease, MFS family n=1 Tax=Streptosporangium subroseum TaxID=106412 RepID=A0A239E6Z0_9ACTN|nr:MFS transporter [Streptosporangium subroseum]SNS40485.1 Predicted arabinose efflux permease, MFS family [Streptosporangium subroseum]